MQINKILEAAQVQRGIIPQTFVCACCGDELDRDEHMKGRMLPEREELMFNRFGPNVCFTCADDYEDDTPCPDCGRAYCTCDEAYEALVAEQLAAE